MIMVLLLATSCSKFQKIMKSDDWRVKYEAALSYYEKKDYFRSIQLFEQILPIIRGTEEAELANFYYAYAHYYQKQYILSGHHFKSFFQIYNRSQYATEAAYMHAYSLYLQSPDYKLDQTVTYEALAELQKFINRFTYTDYAKKADELIDELQVKLETKAYENAKLYYKVRSYKAALISFDNFEKDFPDSKYNEELGYLGVLVAYDLAKETIQSKQEERYKDVLKRHEKYVDKYKESKYLNDSGEIYSKSIQELTTFASRKK